MKDRYHIDKSFGIFAKFSPPQGRFVLWLARIFLTVMPKGLRGKGLDVKKVTASAEGGRRVRAYLIGPKESKGAAPCLVYYHGGGFVFKAARHHYRNALIYVRETGCRLLFVDYRLAPKFAYPAPNEDCYEAYRWAADNAEKLQIDASRMAIGGDSAGACLAADTVRLLKERGAAAPCFAMLLYPVLDRRMQTPSMKKYTDTPMWNAKLNRKMWQYYLGGREFVSPAEYTDVSRFPPAYIETAEYDCLHDEALLFAGTLRAQGVAVTVRETKGTMHGYDIVYRSEITKNSMRARCAALSAAFAGQEDVLQRG